MERGKDVSFGQFRLDATNECLWQGARAISLRPKAFAVLRLLVERSGQLVTKHQVLDTVWPGTFVGDAVLKDSIRQLREALGDDASSPPISKRHIVADTDLLRQFQKTLPPAVPATGTCDPGGRAGAGRCFPASFDTIGALGRETELAKMRDWLQHAIRGERQIVFVTGEAGMGKTTFLQAFLSRRPRRMVSAWRASNVWNISARAKPICRCWTHFHA